ncbi:ATP-binding protein [Rhizobium sp. NRK18]|uniref:ATP-binding protein n=1 Tax=Rhizobium sp. NRK18 TaxID=2964667 RepID=UPI0021C25FAD|nr:ATP-binding protein [Rhizobium sp. NRK18]MCQ2005497.1 ATP-binding protein [Rhizobium sp. NRK18]
MKHRDKTSSEAIRRAGKSTAVLQIFSVMLLAVLAFLYSDISSRYTSLQDGIRENTQWSIYQLDREARTLGFAVDGMLHSPELQTAENYKNMSLRYDILYSRIKLITETRFEKFFTDDRNFADRVGQAEDIIFSSEPFFDKINQKIYPTVEELAELSGSIATLTQSTEKLLLYVNSRLSEVRAESRDEVFRLERTSAIMLGLLFLSVGLLIVMLRRQLKSVRAAGLKLEHMADELGTAYEAADAGNRAKSQFMATMSHEIRTPLNAILGMAELLEMSDLPKPAAANVGVIRSSGEALLEIINEILDFSKIEHGNLDVEERPVDVRELSETVVKIVAGRATQRHNRLILDIPDALEVPCVASDPTRLRQVLLNLMSNAAKFTENGQITLKVRESGKDKDLRLRFEITDTGIGINEEGKKKLFKPFSQVDASISRRYGGTGLGLTICKQIVERMGGELGVESRIGEGSTFWFELPVTRVEAAESCCGKRAERPQGPLARHRVLLVEDNRVNQQVAMRFLDRLGQDVVIAANGAEAVSMATSSSFDIILMDMQMPVMDGIQATIEIRKGSGLNAETPIVAMTANASDDDRQQCRQAGMQGFESKPISLDRLRAVLAAHASVPVTSEGTATSAADHAQDLDQSASSDTALREPISSEEFDRARRQELTEALGEEIFEELLDSYFTDAAALLDELHVALATGDPSGIDKALHTLKGMAANLGFNGVAGMAEQLRGKTPAIADIEYLAEKIEAHRPDQAA